MISWLTASNGWTARWLIERALGGIYFIAFLVAANQFPALLGEKGLLPAPEFLAETTFGEAPSLFHLGYSDRLLSWTCWVGMSLSLALVVGLPQRGPAWVSGLIWFALWALYLSIVNIGQIFYAFGWESMLLEAGFLAIFLGSIRHLPLMIVLLAYRWMLFRVEFGAGLIKLRGDPCWRDLTCLYYHHQTQPMPNPLSWYFHHLPKPIHRLEVAGNHFLQLVVPWGLFAPQPVATVAGCLMVVHQMWLVFSGNFSWLNALTIALAFAAFDDRWVRPLLRLSPPSASVAPKWLLGATLCLGAGVAVLSYWPVRNLISPSQRMNYSFNRFHLVNAYGAFGSITKVRNELVIEGTDRENPSDSEGWKEYEFKGKPGDPFQRPPQIAPYHLRLDWLMWFAAMSPPGAHPWLFALVEKLLANDGPALALLKKNPFSSSPPRYVRISLYRYRFSTWEERQKTGAFWVRNRLSDYLSPMRLRASF